MVPEEVFAAQYGSNPIAVFVSVPNDPSSAAWLLNGQVIEVSLPVTASGKELKDILAGSLGGMPANKQQIRIKAKPDVGFLKDTQSLASLNIGHGAALEMTVRSRGGKK
jgi:hypothetical protein